MYKIDYLKGNKNILKVTEKYQMSQPVPLTVPQEAKEKRRGFWKSSE